MWTLLNGIGHTNHPVGWLVCLATNLLTCNQPPSRLQAEGKVPSMFKRLLESLICIRELRKRILSCNVCTIIYKNRIIIAFALLANYG